MGYITGTEGIVMKQDKILKILKGVYNRGDPPLSIPNREVKPLSADGTALWWESRLAPNYESSHDVNCDCFFLSCVGHDTNLTGSNPVAGIYRQAKRMASR